MPHFKLIKDWIKICNKTHDTCKGNNQTTWTSQTKPTRLIDLRGLRDSTTGFNLIYLVVVAHHQSISDYVTLSHRWGGSKYILTEENLRVMTTQGISLQVLPKTFRDAMKIAWMLGYRYIWIDSLYIIQNSQSGRDWNKESRLMGRIYSNAALNLTALGPSSDVGCFSDRDPLGRLPCRIFGTGDSAVYVQLLQRDLDWYGSDGTSSELLSRGWVVQERLLSRRNVFLGGLELSLECCSTTFSETFPKGRPYGHIQELPLKMLTHAVLEHMFDSNGTTPRSVRESFGEFWFKIVSTYSGAGLTQEEDRPVALQGLANFIQRRTRNQWSYIAGMWQEFLPFHLLWSTWDWPLEDLTTGPIPIREPSWSWWALRHSIRNQTAGVHYFWTERRRRD